jgi:RNase H-fold protein (predicted Holliday junction resolvase)
MVIIDNILNIIGIDLSETVCGIAIYKGLNTQVKNKKFIATPLKPFKYFIHNDKQRSLLLKHLDKIKKQHNINLFILGMSFDKNMLPLPRFMFIQHFANSLYQKTSVKYQLINEYNTTKLAELYNKNKTETDSFAAKIILDRFLKKFKI